MRTALRMTTAAAATAIALFACSSNDATTGKRLSLEARVTASPESIDFTNARGWRIKLSKAVAAVGPLYYYEGEGALARTETSPWPKLRDFIGVRTAFAHPGHYVPGAAKGESLNSASIDLLAGGTLGRGNGVSGLVHTATFSYTPGRADAIVLEGTAEKGGETRAFRAEISSDEVKGADGKPQVEGCPFEPVDMQADGLVTVQVKLPLWFDQVEFDDSFAHNQLVRGTRAAPAYVFSYTAGGS